MHYISTRSVCEIGKIPNIQYKIYTDFDSVENIENIDNVYVRSKAEGEAVADGLATIVTVGLSVGVTVTCSSTAGGCWTGT